MTPSVKSLHIGIAMGKKGTEIAKQLQLFLVEDDLSKWWWPWRLDVAFTRISKACSILFPLH
jgi:hypothetical protein